MMWGPVRKLRERSSVAPTPLATIVFPIGHTVPMVFSGPVRNPLIRTNVRSPIRFSVQTTSSGEPVMVSVSNHAPTG